MKINTNNRSEWRATITLLLKFGYVWHRSSDGLTDIDEIEERWYGSYNHIKFHETNKSISGYRKPYDNGFSIVVDSVKIINRLSGHGAPITIRGVAGYDAIVEENLINVGCQTISLAKFREIQDAANIIRA